MAELNPELFGKKAKYSPDEKEEYGVGTIQGFFINDDLPCFLVLYDDGMFGTMKCEECEILDYNPQIDSTEEVTRSQLMDI